MPYIVLALANLAGVAIAIPRLLFWNTFETDTVLVNAVWTLFNLTLLGAVLGVAAESTQRRGAQRVPKALPARLLRADGSAVACRTVDFSTTGLKLALDEPVEVSRGENVLVEPVVAPVIVDQPVGSISHWQHSRFAAAQRKQSSLPRNPKSNPPVDVLHPRVAAGQPDFPEVVPTAHHLGEAQ